jgi:hypothetical protein
VAIPRGVKEELELAGVTLGADRRLARPLPGEGWSAPRVASELVADPSGRPALKLLDADGENWRNHYRDTGLLEDFVGLVGASDARILRFARKFGAIRFCVHGVAIGHTPLRLSSDPFSPCLEVLSVQATELYRAEAARVSSSLRIAAALHRRQSPPEEALKRLRTTTTGLDLTPFLGSGPPSVQGRKLLMLEVNDRLHRGQVQPELFWPASGPLAELRASGVFGAIARQLLFAVVRIEGLAICTHCGQSFTPSRRPRSQERSWCEKADCRRAMKADATRRSRQRRRSSGRE